MIDAGEYHDRSIQFRIKVRRRNMNKEKTRINRNGGNIKLIKTY